MVILLVKYSEILLVKYSEVLLVKYSEVLLVKYLEILLVKYSEKACGTSSESKEGGRGLEFFLPRMALKLWNNSLHELLVCILKE